LRKPNSSPAPGDAGAGRSEGRKDAIQDYYLIQGFNTLYHRFNLVAAEGARLIVSEHISKLPREQRKCPPIGLVGSGGLKFVYQGLLFKLAVDNEELYGSDELATKMPLHERKSYSCLVRIEEQLWKPWSFGQAPGSAPKPREESKYNRKQG